MKFLKLIKLNIADKIKINFPLTFKNARTSKKADTIKLYQIFAVWFNHESRMFAIKPRINKKANEFKHKHLYIFIIISVLSVYF